MSKVKTVPKLCLDLDSPRGELTSKNLQILVQRCLKSKQYQSYAWTWRLLGWPSPTKPEKLRLKMSKVKILRDLIIFRDFSWFFQNFLRFFKILLRFFTIFQNVSTIFKTFSIFCNIFQTFFKNCQHVFKFFSNIFKIFIQLIPERSAQVQILVYLPSRSGLSTRAVGPGTNFGVFPRSLGA